MALSHFFRPNDQTSSDRVLPVEQVSLKNLDELVWDIDAPICLMWDSLDELSGFLEGELFPFLQSHADHTQTSFLSPLVGESLIDSLRSSVRELFPEMESCALASDDPEDWSLSLWESINQNSSSDGTNFLIVDQIPNSLEASLDDQQRFATLLSHLGCEPSITVIIGLTREGWESLHPLPGFGFLKPEIGIQTVPDQWVPPFYKRSKSPSFIEKNSMEGVNEMVRHSLKAASIFAVSLALIVSARSTFLDSYDTSFTDKLDRIFSGEGVLEAMEHIVTKSLSGTNLAGDYLWIASTLQSNVTPELRVPTFGSEVPANLGLPHWFMTRAGHPVNISVSNSSHSIGAHDAVQLIMAYAPGSFETIVVSMLVIAGCFFLGIICSSANKLSVLFSS